MKTIDELGISPAPWDCHNQFVIYGTMARDILRDGYAALAKASGEEIRGYRSAIGRMRRARTERAMR